MKTGIENGSSNLPSFIVCIGYETDSHISFFIWKADDMIDIRIFRIVFIY